MPTQKRVTLRETVGGYVAGTQLNGAKAQTFLDTAPNPDYYFIHEVAVEQDELPLTVKE